MTQRTSYRKLSTPLGELLLTSNGTALTGVHFDAPAPDAAWQEGDEILREACEQFAAYFAGTLTTFTLPVAASGTPFQLSVWEFPVTISFG